LAEDINVDSILAAYADVLDEQTSEEFIRESTAFGTTPSGDYMVEVAKKEWRHEYREFGGVQKPPRLRAHLQLTVRDISTGAKKGVVFTDASPLMRRYESGTMDNQAKLWGHLGKIHDAAKRGLTARQLFDEIGAFPYKATISELFFVSDGNGGEKPTREKDAAKVAALKAEGTRSMNVVDSLKAAA